MLGTPTATLLEGLPPMNAAITDALRGQRTPLRQLIEGFHRYDANDDGALEAALLDVTVVSECYLSALVWTTETMKVADTLP